MKKRRITAKSSRFCASCKNWYDPANAHIYPDVPALGTWYIDLDAKCPCMARNGFLKAAGDTCQRFESKLK